MKRRALLIIVCLALVFGLPLLLLVRGSAPSSGGVKSASDKTSAAPPAASDPSKKDGEFDGKKYSISDPASIWVVANKHRPLSPKSYAPADLSIIPGGQYMRTEAATALADMINGAKAAGLTLTSPSAYRSFDSQAFVYSKEVNTNGKAVADTQSARPGYSEHQTGLAVDIAGGGCSIADCFAIKPEGKWAAANAHTYGFIVRYPPGKESVTGYRYEPWHFRYVGRELAAEMRAKGIVTLEEYFGLEAAPDYIQSDVKP